MSTVSNRLPATESGAVQGAISGEAALPLGPDRRRRERVAALLLVVLGFLVYNANLRLVSAGDCYPARYLPFGILKYGTLSLDPITDIVCQGHAHPFWCVQMGQHTYSRYPITVPVLATPLYVPAVLYLDRYGWTRDRVETVARIMEKVTAALIASLSVGLMYLLLVRRVNCRWPLLLTLAYGFGTNTWMISSQALWQHGLAELLILLALFLVLGPCSWARALAAGLCLTLIAAARPPDALFAAAIGLYGLYWARGWRAFLVLGGVLPLVPLFTYNYLVAQNLVGGYGVGIKRNPFRYSMTWGLLGLLFSPARGLFVFSPFLLFLPLGVRATLKDPRVRPLGLLVLGAIVTQLLVYALMDWRGGWSWGPRFLTDMVPLLVWLLAAGLATLRPLACAAFVLAVGVSIGVQAIGAFWYTGASDAVIMAKRGDPNDKPEVWDVWNTPFLAELRHDPAPRELLLVAEGSVDRVSIAGRVVERILPGDELTVEGWALADRRSPVSVQVVLMPCGATPWSRDRAYPITGTTTFFERSDVTSTLQSQGPAGWSVTLKTDGLDPGPHLLEVKVQGNPGGDQRHVAKRVIEVVPPGLESSARQATARLAERQHAAGYWLTAHTNRPQFQRPTAEMNVFVTATLVDLLAPLASLNENSARARQHLRDQIESSGLVRYHGRPTGPTIPALGCPITPDADDTALAWRIAGPRDDARQATALATVTAYRDPAGLFRTWLAPRSEFLSIDPGDNPNPPDAGIQLHVLLWLAEIDPETARPFHRTLQTSLADERLWVYYQKTPLVPLLRAAELHNLGYPVPLPPRAVESGQEPWLAACELLARATQQGARRPTAEEIEPLLERLAADDFAAVRTNPPLLYHNDLTAKCRRFYWSEDFGYAVWLRLHRELERTP